MPAGRVGIAIDDLRTIMTDSKMHTARFSAQMSAAEEAARMLIFAWVEFGRVASNDLAADRFPNKTLVQIAGAVAWASDQGIRGMANILTEAFGDAPEGIRSAFIDCCEGYLPPAPEHCQPLVERLRSFHIEMSRRMLGDKIWQAIEKDDPIDSLLAELVDLETGKCTSEIQPFPITRVVDLEGVAEAADFVEGLLTEAGASLVYGPSNCGKSFWALDLAASVATGSLFRGELEVEQGAVVYVALEGSHGARNRVEALKRAGRLPANAPLFLCFAPVSLLEHGHAQRLATTIAQVARQAGAPCRLVILDTLARAMAGGDENAGQDMTSAVQSIDAIRAATGAHVMIVHHCGKDEARGARGHSSLRAAVDTEIEISRPAGDAITTVRVTKQRDLQVGAPMPFSLQVVTLGTDRRGKPITSCVVHHEDEIMASKPSKPGRKSKCSPDDMLQFLPATSAKEWQALVKEETGLGPSQFYDNKKLLEAAGKIRREKGTGKIMVA